MRILHLASTFFPRHTGGKEVFIYHLVKGTPDLQHLVVHHDGAQVGPDEYEGIATQKLPEPVARDAYRSYWSLVYDELPGFREILKDFRPDLVHFHDFCAGASLSHLRICKEEGIRTLVSYHAPGSSCMQKGLIRASKKPCDGAIIDHRCTACRYQVKGIPLSNVLASVRLPMDRTGRYLLRSSTELFHQSFNDFFEHIDAVQAHAQWVKDLLVLNQVSPIKIHMVRLGGHPTIANSNGAGKAPHGPLKVVFLGRCVNIKGAHVLVDAVNKLPIDAPIEVHFFGPYWDDSRYGRSLRKQTAKDKRFIPPRMLPPATIVNEISRMDVCVIPSLWPETGPLSLLDSFAARVPVIGTDLAGIRERIVHGQNGLLFKWGNSDD